MDADFAVELGSDDEVLEMPWAALEGGPRYLDIKRNPALLEQLEEASRFPEFAEFLKVVNSPGSILETAKCDAWSTDEIHPEEEIYALPHKFGCYVDLLFSEKAQQLSFEFHERAAKKLANLLEKVPDIPARAEFLIRRCYYRLGDETKEGFYITFYLFGYGKDEEHARRQWSIGLNLVENALRQLSRSQFT